MVLVVPVNVSFRKKKIQGYLFYWFQNQFKIQEKEGRQKESKKKESFGLRKVKESSFCYFSFTDGEFEPEKYGVPQIDNVDLDVLCFFTSRTDKACLGDLLNSKCFIG